MSFSFHFYFSVILLQQHSKPNLSVSVLYTIVNTDSDPNTVMCQRTQNGNLQNCAVGIFKKNKTATAAKLSFNKTIITNKCVCVSGA